MVSMKWGRNLVKRLAELQVLVVTKLGLASVEHTQQAIEKGKLMLWGPKLLRKTVRYRPPGRFELPASRGIASIIGLLTTTTK